MDTLKKQEEARLAKQQKELRKQENEVKEIMKKKARFDITKKSTIVDSVVGANFDGML
jgi:NAD(P)H-hydrate repair Nnr-like enzyme with NAD(P)H-hydrate epimerase domain